MINLRYHIVSITAVFLALGIGLTLGSSFLDRVTVDNLKHRLDTVQDRVSKSEAANNTLTDRVGALETRDRDLGAELPERMLGNHLTGVPVLVIATEGTDEALVDRTIAALTSSGAQVAGGWWLTDRWKLEDSEAVADLAKLLELSTTDPVRLRRNAAIRVVELLNAASAVPPLDGRTAPTAGVPSSTEPSEFALIAALKDRGFINYRAIAGSGDGRVLLPPVGARYVVVSGAQPDAGSQLITTELLDGIVANGIAPVVATQGEVDLPDKGKPEGEDARRSTFVGPLRSGDLTRERLSTVDNLDTAAGLAALVLAVEDLGIPRVGHYGSASTATRLLPAVPTGD